MVMEINESMERVREGLKQAASCCRQLGKAQKSTAWTTLAKALENSLKIANGLEASPAMSRQEALDLIDIIVAKKVAGETKH